MLVLGATGMLGAMVADVLSREDDLRVTATARGGRAAVPWAERLEGVEWTTFGGAADLDVVAGHDWVVNCVGVIKPLIDDGDAAQVENAIRVNALLPHELAARAADAGAGVLQIATDCVYSGASGRYVEEDVHDALDVYGKTKSLGEVSAPNVRHLRCSIVGPEAGQSRSLLEWFRGQSEGAPLSGYVNHRWNGLTTLHYARLCLGIVRARPELPLRQHVIPAGEVTKHELLLSFAHSYGRGDLQIDAVDAPTVIDRTLRTSRPDVNELLWRAAGYDEPPAVPEMVAELARFDFRPTSLERAPV